MNKAAAHFLNQQAPINGVYRLSPKNDAFEQEYNSLRDKEGWVTNDKDLRLLPITDKQNAHYTFWKMRQNSCSHFCTYLIKKQGPLNVLEVGCGNGWFSHAIKQALPKATVFGLDINLTELEQAARVFKQDGLHWLYADLFTATLPNAYFDVIVLNASLQYFSSIPPVFQLLFKLLAADGELHVMDTAFYRDNELEAARKRSQTYFAQQQHPGMQQYYHHHSFSDLQRFGPQTMYAPNTLLNKLLHPVGIYSSPFYWLMFSKADKP